MSSRHITNKFLGKIGNSDFHWNTPYYVKEIPTELFPVDNSYFTKAFGYDGTPKKCMSFWLSNSPWEWDDENHDYEIHFHCYPDDGNECYNPEMKMPEGITNKEKLQILVNFLKKNAIGVNKEIIEKRITEQQKELDKTAKIIENYKSILEQI